MTRSETKKKANKGERSGSMQYSIPKYHRCHHHVQRTCPPRAAYLGSLDGLPEHLGVFKHRQIHDLAPSCVFHNIAHPILRAWGSTRLIATSFEGASFHLIRKSLSIGPRRANEEDKRGRRAEATGGRREEEEEGDCGN
eukprot:3843224-Rhodomonas_salina.1